MASAIVRSSIRSALRGGVRVNPSATRSFSSGASVEEEARTILLSLQSFNNNLYAVFILFLYLLSSFKI